MLVGGLWMVANMNDTNGKDILPNMATGGLMGGGLGAVIGVVEIGLCTSGKDGSAARLSGFQIPKLWVQAEQAAFLPTTGLHFSYFMK